MKCPYCYSTESKVTDKRTNETDASIRRRRECLSCEKRFTTYERLEDVKINIIKKDGKKEPFCREKLKGGMILACEKRPVTDEQIDAAVAEIEAKVRSYKDQDVNSKVLGRWVMQKLKKLDKMAYIRYTSVHKEVTDLQELVSEIKKIS